MIRVYKYILAIIIGLSFSLPIIWLFLLSFKNRVDIFSTPPNLLEGFNLTTIYKIFTDTSFIHSLLNSLLVGTISTCISIILAIICAYSITRNAESSKNIFNFILSTILIPPVTIVLPLYLVINKLHLTGNILSLILVHIGILLPFGILLLTSFFKRTNINIDEISMIHNIPFSKFIFDIFIPETKNAIYITSFLMILLSWNEFLFAIILTDIDSKTLPVLIEGLVTPIGTYWGKIAQVSLISSIPIISLGIYFRKHLTTGFTFGFIDSK